MGYSIKGLPTSAIESFAGCGNPVAIAELKEGETVLDLGSGAGLDVFMAARKVGDKGRVIGVDMTPEMLEKANENAKAMNAANVEFRHGDIEDLPVADESVDVVISNCVINLAPDKARVFREAFRVLKPGGRMMISDIVLEKPLPKQVRDEIITYTGCLGGAILEKDYLDLMRRAGFVDVGVLTKSSDGQAASAKIRAMKPVG
jgi:ubiquinone/menaquinone biosynthesis C-methylase UbiE